LHAFRELPEEPNKLTKEIIDRDGIKQEIVIMCENEIGLTTKELVQKTCDVMKIKLSADQVRKQFLYPLANMGIINMTKSVINRNENLCSPVEDTIFSLFDSENNGDEGDVRLKILDYRVYPTRNVLEEEFRSIVKHNAKEGGNENNFKRYKILDVDGAEITVSQLIDKYLSGPDTCFIKGYPEFNDDNEAATTDE
jgi:hypothetical protein